MVNSKVNSLICWFNKWFDWLSGINCSLIEIDDRGVNGLWLLLGSCCGVEYFKDDEDEDGIVIFGFIIRGEIGADGDWGTGGRLSGK